MILSSIKIVKDDQGRYAIRRRILFFFSYKDLTGDFWWDYKEHVKKYDTSIWSHDLEKVLQVYAVLKSRRNIMIRLWQSFRDGPLYLSLPQGKAIPAKHIDIERVQSRLQRNS